MARGSPCGSRDFCYLLWESAHGWEPAGEVLAVLRDTWTRAQLERMDLLISESGSIVVRLSFSARWLEEVRGVLAAMATTSGFEVVEPAAATPEARAAFAECTLADARLLEGDVIDARSAWARAVEAARQARSKAQRP